MLATNLAKIIEYLIRNIPQKFNINQIARTLNISVGSAYKILKSLTKKGIVVSQGIGNAIYYNLNLNSNEAKNLAELVLIENRNKALSKNPQAIIYAKDLQEINKLSRVTILFGSILERKNAKDVDVLFVINKGMAKRVEDFCLKLSSLRPKRVNPLIMTAEDLKKNIRKQDKVVSNILRKGIILLGEGELVKILKGV